MEEKKKKDETQKTKTSPWSWAAMGLAKDVAVLYKYNLTFVLSVK
jgi:hypothetical protein